MKIKTLFISILAATCLGISACNPKDAPKSSEEPVASSSIEELSSDEPIESSEDPVASSEEPVSSEEPISSEEPPHEHSFGDWTEVKAPTCTEKGKEERVCACGEKEERDVDALGHNPGEWEVALEPTVDAEGQKVKKCTRCQEVLETEVIDKLTPPESNDGSLEHPFTVSEGYAIAAELEQGKNTEAQYFIKGKVTGEVSFYKGRLSFNITDGNKELYVYNMNNDENKASGTETQDTIKTDVEIIVAGTFKNYNGTLEICYVKNVADCYLANIIS